MHQGKNDPARNVTDQALTSNPFARAMGQVNTCPLSVEYDAMQESDRSLGKVSDLVKRIDNYLQFQAKRFPLFYTQIRDEKSYDQRVDLLHQAEMIYEEYMMLLFLRKLMLRAELRTKWKGDPYVTLRAGRVAVITAEDQRVYDQKARALFAHIDRHKTPPTDNPVARIRGVEEFLKVST